MDILNKKERFNAFMLFLLMFFITTGVLITAIFFNFKLPLKENEVLKSENDKMNAQFTFNNEFTEKIEGIGKLVDSLDKAPESFQFIEQSINYDLVELKEKIPNDSLINTRLYDNIILTLKSYVNAKKKIILSSKSDEEVDELKEEIKDLKEENKDLSKQIEYLQIMSNR
ncbi:MAG: hypothetical protein HC854_03395 [Flavobacterium sp.]|nr:hypothetical protein [Flavobacterium sp.]